MASFFGFWTTPPKLLAVQKTLVHKGCSEYLSEVFKAKKVEIVLTIWLQSKMASFFGFWTISSKLLAAQETLVHKSCSEYLPKAFKAKKVEIFSTVLPQSKMASFFGFWTTPPKLLTAQKILFCKSCLEYLPEVFKAKKFKKFSTVWLQSKMASFFLVFGQLLLNYWPHRKFCFAKVVQSICPKKGSNFLQSFGRNPRWRHFSVFGLLMSWHREEMLGYRGANAGWCQKIGNSGCKSHK